MNADLRIADIALRQHGVFTRDQAAGAGMTPAMARHRLATGRWGRMHAHVFRLAGTPPTWEQALFGAWLAGGEGAVVSHAAAARCWDIPGPEERQEQPERLEITVPPGHRPGPAGVRVHRAVVPACDWARHGERFNVTTVPRTLVDLAADLTPAALAVALDHCLARRLTTVGQLGDRLAALGRPGRKGAGTLAGLLEARSSSRRAPESELERRLLRVLEPLPGPSPVAQHEVRLPGGRVVRLDVAYPDVLLALEADSYTHHSSRTDWSADQTRRNQLIAAGWRVLPFTWEDVTRRPQWVRELVGAARSAQVCTQPAAG